MHSTHRNRRGHLSPDRPVDRPYHWPCRVVSCVSWQSPNACCREGIRCRPVSEESRAVAVEDCLRNQFATVESRNRGFVCWMRSESCSSWSVLTSDLVLLSCRVLFPRLEQHRSTARLDSLLSTPLPKGRSGSRSFQHPSVTLPGISIAGVASYFDSRQGSVRRPIIGPSSSPLVHPIPHCIA